MAITPQQEVLRSLRTLYCDKEYSDFTISYGTQSQRVHKAIICPRSKFFAAACKAEKFKEGHTGTVGLHSDDPRIVEMMIYYFYHLDYNVDSPTSQANGSSSTSTDANNTTQPNGKKGNRSTKQASNSPSTPNIVTHVRVYSLAEKYLVEGLKRIACDKFKAEVARQWSSQDFLDAVREAYTSTIESDRGLRDVITSAFYDHPTLLDKQDTQQLLRDLNALSVDLVLFFRQKFWRKV
ncbi:BTB/POZ protein [Biscogniauxia mediterranea]|nr:BTB/POZ protein [Biscogniauxia mediterranea]